MNKRLERAAEYRAQAAELLRLSERQVDERQKTTFVELATTYHRLAEQLEEMVRLDGDPPRG